MPKSKKKLEKIAIQAPTLPTAKPLVSEAIFLINSAELLWVKNIYLLFKYFFKSFSAKFV